MTKRFHPYEIEGDMAMPFITDDGQWFNGRIRTRPDRLSIPLKRRNPTVYAVWNDLFHEAVPSEFIDQAFNEIGFHNIHHIFLILSKRPCRMLGYYKRLQVVATHPLNPFPNVWTGLTICNQLEAYEKQSDFKRVPGNKFLSLEPLLSDIPFLLLDGIGCVICGGETGPGARPMHPDWVRSVRDQCAAASVPFFFKGWGEYSPSDQCETHRFVKPVLHNCHVWEDCSTSWRYGKKYAGRLLDGLAHDKLPWNK